MLKDFRGEIWTNTDPRVLEAMVKANDLAVDGCVGADSHSIRAAQTVQGYFEKEVYVAYTINGTGANIIALKAMLDRYSSVICANETHINVYEAGAFEYTVGCKILSAESEDAKLTPTLIERLLKNNKKYKYNPKVVVITEPTELGVLYTRDELKELVDYVHSLGMYVFVDGARIGNALAALELNLAQLLEYADVDAFTIGGTKSGAMFGEMVVFRRKEFAKNIEYIKKQSLQHFDRSKFIGVQFERLFQDDLWLENAKKANAMAKVLEAGFKTKGIYPYLPVQANMVFVSLEPEMLSRICEHYDLHYWNEELKTVRFATTSFTTPESIDKLISLI